MSNTRSKRGNNVEHDETENDVDLSNSGAQPLEMSADEFFASLGNGDTVSIERMTPLRDRGWLTNIPYSAGIDFEQEISESYGGGTYLLRFKRRSKDGKMLFSRGSATVTIAGRPKLESSSGAVQVLAGMPASVAPDMQARLFDLLQSQLGNKSEEIPGLVGRIVDVVTGRNQPQVDPMAQMMAAATSAKQLAAMFEAPKVENPAGRDGDDDDDDEEGGGDNSSMMEKFMMMMAAKMMGGEGQKAPQSAAPMSSAPPGWRQDETGRWVQLPPSAPPGWARSQNGQWYRVTGGQLVSDGTGPTPREPQPFHRESSRDVGPRQVVVKREVPLTMGADKAPHSGRENRKSASIDTDSHQGESMGGGADSSKSESGTIEGKLRICLVCSGDGQDRDPVTDEPRGTCPICDGLGSVRVVNPPKKSAARPDELIGSNPPPQDPEMRHAWYSSTVRNEKLIACPHCENGYGTNETNPIKCGSCGLQFLVDPRGNSRFFEEQCGPCEGTGWIDEDGQKIACPECEGDGFEPDDDDEDEPLTPDDIAGEFEAMTPEEKKATLEKMAPSLGLDPAMVAALFEGPPKEEGEK